MITQNQQISLRYGDVPYGWALCYIKECTKKEECLRYQVCNIIPIGVTKNACVFPNVLRLSACSHFHPIQVVRAAAGFRNIFSEVKEKHHASMRSEIAHYLGSGGTFYRYRNGERLLMPEQQEWIKKEDDAQKVINAFLGEGQGDESGDVREQYRYEEFEVFQKNSKSLESNDKLIFNDIEMPEPLCPYFHKIQQVSTLGVSNTQINFSRVSMPQPELKDDGTIDYPNRMKIFSEAPEDVLTMPAVQSFGEGLFFCFNEETMSVLMSCHQDFFKERYKAMSEHDDTFESIYREMKLGGIARFLVLHTFSHILMKELEFSCGYPTASMCERLYFSDRMCGVLIYTTDGAEGSMGGLVWQGQPELIENIIRKAMQRAMNCASDPICWENEDQLNYAACFSCAMVSETSCEKRNVGLDRRILVDSEFGYFKDII